MGDVADCAPTTSAPTIESVVKRPSVFWKLTRRDEVHNGFSFRDGWNDDPIPFQTAEECRAGGFYMCEDCEVHHWLDLFSDDLAWVRQVKVDDSTPLHKESNDKWKAPRIFLYPRQCVREWLSQRPAVMLAAANVGLLCYVPQNSITPEMALAAVKADPSALRFVPYSRKTNEVILEAVSRRGGMLYHVDESLQTPEVCHAAVDSNGEALGAVATRLRTLALCRKAVKGNRFALQFVPPELLAEVKRKEDLTGVSLDSALSLHFPRPSLSTFRGPLSPLSAALTS